MLKWILLVLGIAFVYYFFFKRPNSSQKKKNNSTPKESLMLECHNCGTYVTNDEAILQDGKYYCSKECAKC